eukprot:900482-Heterocapsa_arctica.AAC.1
MTQAPARPSIASQVTLWQEGGRGSEAPCRPPPAVATCPIPQPTMARREGAQGRAGQAARPW